MREKHSISAVTNSDFWITDEALWSRPARLSQGSNNVVWNQMDDQPVPPAERISHSIANIRKPTADSFVVNRIAAFGSTRRFATFDMWTLILYPAGLANEPHCQTLPSEWQHPQDSSYQAEEVPNINSLQAGKQSELSPKAIGRIYWVRLLFSSSTFNGCCSRARHRACETIELYCACLKGFDIIL